MGDYHINIFYKGRTLPQVSSSHLPGSGRGIEVRCRSAPTRPIGKRNDSGRSV